MTIVKSASPTTYSALNQKITYTYVVKNTGNVNIKGSIKVTDNKIGAFTISQSDLAPGKSVTGKATYKISQANLNSGSVTNTAYATGKYKTCKNGYQQIKSNVATATVTTNKKPALTIAKSASPTTYSALSQKITYKYVVKNTGKVKITGLTVTDNKTKVTLPSKTIEPGKSVTGTATYTITQADLDTGSVTNKAYATGKYNNQQVKSNEATATVTAAGKPSLSLEKTASPKKYSTAGQTITYAYKVTNTGSVVISGPIKVTDDKLGTVLISNTALGPGKNITGTATYTITQADIKAGSVTNEALATGIYNCKEVKSNAATEIITGSTDIPEFPSIALPVAAILGLIFISQYRRKEK